MAVTRHAGLSQMHAWHIESLAAQLRSPQIFLEPTGMRV